MDECWTSSKVSVTVDIVGETFGPLVRLAARGSDYVATLVPNYVVTVVPDPRRPSMTQPVKVVIGPCRVRAMIGGGIRPARCQAVAAPA